MCCLMSWKAGMANQCTNFEGESDDVAIKISQQESCQWSGPKEYSQKSKKVNPWSSCVRAKDGSWNVSFGSVEIRTNSTKGKEKVNQHMASFDVFSIHASSDESLYEEFGIPNVKTLGVQRMEGEIGLHMSTCVKYPLKRLIMISLQHIIMPTWLRLYRFKNWLALKKLLECLNGIKLWMRRWINLMSIKHGIWHLYHRGRKPLDVNGCIR